MARAKGSAGLTPVLLKDRKPIIGRLIGGEPESWRFLMSIDASIISQATGRVNSTGFKIDVSGGQGFIEMVSRLDDERHLSLSDQPAKRRVRCS